MSKTAALLFRQAFTKKNLKAVYNEKVSSSKATGIDRLSPNTFAKHFKDHVDTVHLKVRSGNYKFTPYKEQLVSKGANSLPRVISIPTIRDRLVLRTLCELLTTVFPEAVTEIPQSKISAIKDALKSGKYGEFIKIDLHQFYPSIQHEKLLTALKERVRKPEILALIKGAITTPTVPLHLGGKDAPRNHTGVPQGLAISNVLAEILLLKFDESFSKKTDICYQRYVDDILILCPKGQSKRIAEEAFSGLKGLGLRPHEFTAAGSKSRTGELNEHFEFLGYAIDAPDLLIRKQSIHKFEASLAKIFTGYRHRLTNIRSANPAEKQRALDICEWRLNLRITGCIFGKKRLGWVFYFSQISSTTNLRAVDKTITSLLERFGLKGAIKTKRLLKTFYESRRKEKAGHTYIPNFDEMPITEKRRVLTLLLGPRGISKATDKRIEQLFAMRISSAVKELEQDLGGLS